jgi:hypothetical protein
MNRIILVVGTLVLSLAPLSPKIPHEVAEARIGSPGRITGANEERLMELALRKVARYCQRLERVSLHFVCNEEIGERVYFSWRPPSAFAEEDATGTWSSLFRENSYVYDYQLIRKNREVKERRVLLYENGQKRHEENAELRTERFRHKYVIFGPLGLLGESQQQNHEYVLKKEERFNGEGCLIIEAIPKANARVEHLFGRVWVRKDDFSIMKIEWNQASMGNIRGIEEEAKRIGARPSLSFVSEYAYEKNGIRFPSQYFVKEEYIHPGMGRILVSETKVVYKDYRFFVVETEVEIKKGDES